MADDLTTAEQNFARSEAKLTNSQNEVAALREIYSMQQQGTKLTAAQKQAVTDGNGQKVLQDLKQNKQAEIQQQAEATSAAESGGASSSGKREVQCPFCTGQVLAKSSGRPFATISGFLQRSFAIVIPTALMSYLKEKMPVSKQDIFKEGCPTCKGKGSIEDPSDDTAKYEQVKANFGAASQEIQEAENQLAPTGGNRYTIIQGCDLLEVGLGMNDAPSYRVEIDKNIRNKGLVDPGQINTKKAGPQIPEGGFCNHVQGINSVASPGGHYVIKCSNKFTVLVGAQGIDMNTGGPLTINAGITRITGPEISIGSQKGRLSLQGDVVDIGGRSVEISPTDGHLFVKGTISNTGNLVTGGHVHAESISFVKAECTGRNEASKVAAASDMTTGPAFWGSIAMEGITSTVKDMIGFVLSKTTSVTESPQILTPRFIESLRDKMLSMTYNMRPYEMVPTGVIMPGTCIVVGTGNLGYPVVSVNPSYIPIFNFPHTHAMPDGAHVHETRVPNIDYSADSAQEVRSKQGGVTASAPLHKSSTSALQAVTGLFSAIGSVFVAIWKGVQGESGPFMK